MASQIRCITAVWGVAFLGLVGGDARADGYHGAVMSTQAPEAWVATAFQHLNAAIPNLDQKLQAGPRAAGNDSTKLEVGNVEDLKNRSTDPPPSNSGRPKKTTTAPRAKSPQAGGRLQAEFTDQERALLGRASDASLEVLAYLNPENIFPHEFPNFPLNRIADYRAGAKRILGATGPVGADAVVQSIRNELMAAGGRGNPNFGLAPHPLYHKDLLEALQDAAASGYVTREHVASLREAAAGAKSGPQAALAQEVQRVLPDLERVSLATVLKWAEETQDPARKQDLYDRAERWIASAGMGDLIKASQSLAESKDLKQAKRFQQLVAAELAKRAAKADLDDLLLLFKEKVELDSRSQEAAEKAIIGRLDEAGIAQLLSAAEHGPTEVQRAALAHLAQRSPTYAEVKDELPAIWAYANSQNQAVSDAANQQSANAFQRAPMSHCLYWLPRADAGQKDLIWQQVDGRIARSDASRRAEYRQTGIQVAGTKEAEVGARVAAVELLGRLKDPEAVGPLVDILSLLPRECWPAAGKSLQALTGQDYGPRAGAGVADVSAAVKKWRAWLAENGK
jgi:hypothetical protein